MGDITDDGESVAMQTDRRELLTKGAVAAAVAAVAGLAVSSRASAANGDTMFVGLNNTGTALTTLTGSTFRVVNGATDVPGIGTPSVHGTNNATIGVGVLGQATGTEGYGVYGTSSSTVGAGVYGLHDGTGAGAGVYGRSTDGAGVVGDGGTFDLVAFGSGRVWLESTGPASPPSGGALGTIARDDAGNLWFAYAADKWIKLGGPATAGSFHAVNPFRAYDSRLAAYSPNGVMGPNTNRVVSVKDAHNASGAVTVADSVPAGATAVAINVTVAGPTGPNFLSVTPGDAASFTASTLNWAGGYDIANGAIIKLDASRQLKLFCGDQSGSAHVIVDVTGYYL